VRRATLSLLRGGDEARVRGVRADLERLIADPGRKHRAEFASSYAISALKSIADSEVLPDDIRVLVQRVLELYETASNPFLGVNLADQKQRQPDKPRVDIEVADAEAQAHQDWSNDE
jgi:hypothetical protein